MSGTARLQSRFLLCINDLNFTHMKTNIQRLVSLIVAVATSILCSAGTVSLSFSGTTTEGRYCLLDSVRIENISQNTTQMVDCELDTSCVIEVSYVSTGIDNIYNSETTGEGLISNCYHNVYGETFFSVNPYQDGLIHICIIDMAGRIIIEHVEYLYAGSHQFELHLNTSQAYVLYVASGNEKDAKKIINLADMGECSLCHITSFPHLSPRRVAHTESPDLICYTGYTNQKGQAVASEPITQYQSGDEHIVLQFAPVAKSQEGMYVGMTGFNSQLYQYPFDILTASNLSQHKQFVNNLQMASGTILYHAVYTALDNVIKAPVPQEIENVTLVTFTDGLDIGSWRMNSAYPSEALYLAAVNRQIRRTYIDGIKLDAYAIGVMGSDVTDVARFENDLHQLASDSANVYNVTNMDEVKARFREIAAKIYNTKVAYSLTIKLPAPDPGSIIRFTFDNVSNAENSIYYIEGTYNYDFDKGAGLLQNVTYSGVTCSNGTTWESVPSGIFDLFTIENLTTSLGERVSTNAMQQWSYIPSTQSWQVNSEFNPSTNSTTTENHSSAIVMLVLDCSSSLSSDFNRMQTAANTFLNILAGNGDISKPSISNANFTLGDLQVTMEASITNTGNLTINDKGFCISENPNMDDAIFYSAGTGTDNFNYVLSDLVAGKTYYCRPYAENSWGRAFGAMSSFVAIEFSIPTVTTSDVSNITINSAKCGGNISFDGYTAITERGLCWSTNPNPTINDNNIVIGSGVGEYSGTINGLQEGTIYYVRAYAKNNKGIGYGEDVSFTTIAIIPPTVSTNEVTNITINSASCGGRVTDNGNSSIIERGLCWSKAPNPTIMDSVLTINSGKSTFDGTMQNLEDGTTYYVRAYAKNSKCIGYGETQSFMTIAIVPPTVITLDVTEITTNSAKCGGEIASYGYSAITEYGLCWSTTPNPTVTDSVLVIGSGNGTFDGTLQNLEEGSTYYVRAYARNKKCIGYGVEKNFTTLSITEPIVTLTAANVNSIKSAYCQGNVTFDGNSPIIERGFCWSTSQNPTIENRVLITSSGIGEFDGDITNLQTHTTYYVRAYAKNRKHLGYSQETRIIYITSINYTANSILQINNNFYDQSAIRLSIASHTFNNGKGTIVIDGCVTSIGNNAFYNCTELTSITIPNSVTSIGNDAFYNCTGLTSITIPNSVTSIGNNAFYNCTGLTSITIPNSVTSIGDGAFSSCSGLTNVSIPNSVTSIGNNAFYNCKGLTSVTIPNSVTSIGNSAFSGCTGLTSVTIGNSVTSIGERAFHSCTGLTSITLPNSVISIEEYTFYGCTSLNSITIPNSVTSIGNCAFYNCTGLTSVTIPNSVTSIGNSTFFGCAGLTSIIIPNSVTSIGERAFHSCTGLTSITLPNSVISIEEDTFYGCTSLNSITIPNSVTSIGDWAFFNCTKLSSVTISNSVSSIGQGTFFGCAKLRTVTNYATTPQNINSGVFGFSLNPCTLYVPMASLSKYKSASVWKTFGTIAAISE